MIPKGERQSSFAKRLASEPELAAWCEGIVAELRKAVSEELKAIERSEQLTDDDLKIIINARAN